MRTKQQCIADAIAKKIMANTRRRFSTLHAEALEEFQMSNETENQNASQGGRPDGSPADGRKLEGASDNGKVTSGMSVSSQVNVGPMKQVGHNSYEGSNQGDHRAPKIGADIT